MEAKTKERRGEVLSDRWSQKRNASKSEGFWKRIYICKRSAYHDAQANEKWAMENPRTKGGDTHLTNYGFHTF